MSANQPRNVKLVTEAVRERETFKYEPNLLSDFKVNNTGRLLPASELYTSEDGVLTALAQVGTYQTGTDRALISLFDTNFQYIIAEAVPSISLASRLPSSDCPLRLLHCGTAIPREHGLCQDFLYPPPASATEERHPTTELPVTVIDDVSKDDRSSLKPCFDTTETGQFYASVPIRTRGGINIGVYCVFNSIPILWDDKCNRCLRDVSSAITDHLGVRRLKHAYRRNERVNRGLGSFVEGKSTLSGWRSGPNTAAYADGNRSEGLLDTKQQRLEVQVQDTKGEELEGHASGLNGPFNTTSNTWAASSGKGQNDGSDAQDSAHLNGLHSAKGHRGDARSTPTMEPERVDDLDSPSGSTTLVFAKAANIIREAFEVEGCLFFDVTFGSYRDTKLHSPTVERDMDGMPNPSTACSSSSSDDQLPSPHADKSDSACDLLGFSTSGASSINRADINGCEEAISKRFLAKLLRRYPDGKIFNFDAVGELQSSDSSEDDAVLKELADDPEGIKRYLDRVARRKQHQQHSQYSRFKEGAVIHQAFPSARSVAFVPIWDSKRERWFAGGFVYTLTPARVFTIEGELSVLKAFAKLIATEIHNVETLQSDKAKSDTLGSLSHELRSPLHGIILGTELLSDTDLSVFQNNAAHTIETCSRTLLDTIDHLLDFSKVNSFGAKAKQEASKVPPKLRKRTGMSQFGKKMLHSHTRLDGLVEEVMDSMFAGFNFQHMSVKQFSMKGRAPWSDASAHSQMDSTQAVEQLDVGIDIAGGTKTQFGDVAVYLAIDPACQWMFYVQPGAVRRIVMNLFGNSLRYTSKGSIHVTLKQETAFNKRGKSEQLVRLTVQDTGKGISEDYLRHKLFTPFAQENELGPGTGLGLSIVKSIVTQLGGRISLESRVGLGTSVTVKLPLEESSPGSLGAPDLPDDDREFEHRVKELTGLRVRLVGFQREDGLGAAADGRAVVESICRDWLHLEIVTEDQLDSVTPDLVLWLDAALPKSATEVALLAGTPNIVICKNAMVAYQQFTAGKSTGQSGIFEFITQPVGPRKLAKSMQLAYERWMGLPKLLSDPSPEPTRSSSTHSIQLKAEASPQMSSPLTTSNLAVNSPLQPYVHAHTTATDATSASPSPSSSSEKLANSTDEGSQLAESIEAIESTESKPQPVVERTLLVDDNHINLKILSAYMGKLGRLYELATNGKEALDAYTADASRFSGILMDISMPVMDGLESTRHIRAFEHQHKLPPVSIIALTGLASESAQQEALGSGVNAFLTKPVRLKTLGEALEANKILRNADGTEVAKT